MLWIEIRIREFQGMQWHNLPIEALSRRASSIFIVVPRPFLYPRGSAVSEFQFPVGGEEGFVALHMPRSSGGFDLSRLYLRWLNFLTGESTEIRKLP